MGVLTEPRCGENAASQQVSLDLDRSPTHHSDCKTHRYRKQKVEHDRSWRRGFGALPACASVLYPRACANHTSM